MQVTVAFNSEILLESKTATALERGPYGGGLRVLSPRFLWGMCEQAFLVNHRPAQTQAWATGHARNPRRRQSST